MWGLKGDAFAFGFPYDPTVGAENLTQPAVGLSATESKATIFKGTNNFGLPTGPLVWNQNPGVDNAQFAFDATGDVLATHQININDPVAPTHPLWLHVQSSLNRY